MRRRQRFAEIARSAANTFEVPTAQVIAATAAMRERQEQAARDLAEMERHLEQPKRRPGRAKKAPST